MNTYVSTRVPYDNVGSVAASPRSLADALALAEVVLVPVGDRQPQCLKAGVVGKRGAWPGRRCRLATPGVFLRFPAPSPAPHRRGPCSLPSPPVPASRSEYAYMCRTAPRPPPEHQPRATREPPEWHPTATRVPLPPFSTSTCEPQRIRIFVPNCSPLPLPKSHPWQMPSSPGVDPAWHGQSLGLKAVALRAKVKATKTPMPKPYVLRDKGALPKPHESKHYVVDALVRR